MDKRQIWQEEFGDEYQVPVWTAQPGVEDQSWHNDACPSFWVPGTEIRLWVYHPDATLREFWPLAERFAFSRVDKKEGGPVDELTLETNDEGIARSAWEWVCRTKPSFEAVRGWVAACKHNTTNNNKSNEA